MKELKIGLIGWGTVGTGVVKILRDRSVALARRIGAKPVLARIADLDLKSSRGLNIPHSLLTRDAYQILDDPEIKIVVECIGGLNPARKYVTEGLRRGKQVVTANKALLAEKGKEILDLASKTGSNIFFEASVGGGIPIVRSLRKGLAANKISSILGIINGTSNFILSRMSEADVSLEQALSEAKERGYVESDPELDLEGIDSAHKLVILASLAFGSWIDRKEVYTEGIKEVTRDDIIYTGDLGYVVKSLAIAKQGKTKLEMRVHPTLIPANHLLASVGGVFNAIYVDGSYSGQIMFYGKGAGQFPAASAVVADIIEAGQNILAGKSTRPPAIAGSRSVNVLPIGAIKCRHYIRIPAVDRPGVLAKIAAILSSFDIGIASVIQRGRRKRGVVPVILMTHRAQEDSLKHAVGLINRLKVVKGKCMRLRVEE